MLGAFSTSARSGCAPAFWFGAPLCGVSVARVVLELPPPRACFRRLGAQADLAWSASGGLSAPSVPDHEEPVRPSIGRVLCVNLSHGTSGGPQDLAVDALSPDFNIEAPTGVQKSPS